MIIIQLAAKRSGELCQEEWMLIQLGIYMNLGWTFFVHLKYYMEKSGYLENWVETEYLFYACFIT